MFGRKKQKNPERIIYDREVKTPVIRCSICNGEQVGGLKDRLTGVFEEIMVIRSEADLAAFREMVGKTDIPKEY